MGTQCPHCGSMDTGVHVVSFTKFMAKYYGWHQAFSTCSECGWIEPVCLPADDEYAGDLPADLLKEQLSWKNQPNV